MSKGNHNRPPAESRPPDARELRDALKRVMEALMFRHAPGPALNSLPMSQFRCLMDVHHHQGRKMVDIAASLGLGVSALSQVVDRLVRRGLVDRVPDPDDRRVIRLKPSAAAAALLREHFEAMGLRMAAAAAKLGDEDMQRVTEGLRLLAEAAEASIPNSGERTPSPDNSTFLSKIPYLRP